MFSALMRVRDRFFGDGEASVAIPVFDGPLKPNNLLETAPVLLEKDGLDDLIATTNGELYASCGNEVLRVSPDGGTDVVASFDHPVRALAAFGGGLAVATGEHIVFSGGEAHGKQVDAINGLPLTCITALCQGGAGKLLISHGSRSNPSAQWAHDLLSHGASGQVIEYEPGSGAARVLASGLQYCYGVCSDGERVLASESWSHRLLAIEHGKRLPVVTALPGYPSRISPAGGGGYWLSVFAARTQLLEFVLREDDYRNEMMRTVEPRYWIAPALSSGADFREPLQLGGVRQMGILKPWAPPRSYGLVIRLDANLQPCYSLHSRAGGRNHGIVATAEQAGNLLVLSKGAGRILRLSLADMNLQDASHDSRS